MSKFIQVVQEENGSYKPTFINPEHITYIKVETGPKDLFRIEIQLISGKLFSINNKSGLSKNEILNRLGFTLPK